MLKTQKPLYRILLILCLVLLVPVAMINGLFLVDPKIDLLLRISGGLSLVSLVVAFVYVVLGSGKSTAWAYKVFSVCFTLSVFFRLMDTVGTAGSVGVGLLAFAFGLLTAITVSKDMGKANALTVSILVLASTVGLLVWTLFSQPEAVFAGTLETAGALLGILPHVMLALMLCILTIAKYIDKTIRGAD